MVLKLNNFGAFFTKKGNEVFIVAYMKTNYLRKNPKYANKKEFHVPNMLATVIFDDTGRDYIADKPILMADFNKLITEDFKRYFDFNEFATYEELYAAMKATGLKRKYTPAWFEKQFQFVTNQMTQL